MKKGGNFLTCKIQDQVCIILVDEERLSLPRHRYLSSFARTKFLASFNIQLGKQQPYRLNELPPYIIISYNEKKEKNKAESDTAKMHKAP